MTKWELIKRQTVKDLADAYMVDMSSPSDWKEFAEVVGADLQQDAEDEYRRMLAEGVFEEGELYGY